MSTDYRRWGSRHLWLWAAPVLAASLVLCGCSATSLLVSVKSDDAAAAAALAGQARVATPSLSPASGIYGNDQSVVITNLQSGATLHYTVTPGSHGVTPTESSPVYTQPITVSGNGTTETVEAIAVQPGVAPSDVAVVTVAVNYSLVTSPYFNPNSGTFPSNEQVAIGDSTAGASIYYTTDGSTPSESNGSLYTAPISISGDGTSKTIQAVAVKAGLSTSNVATSSYTISYSSTWAPVFNPSPGTYSTNQSVSISDQSSGATIHYTTDGTLPTQSSPVYSNPISIAGDGTSKTIDAIATQPGEKDSTVSVATYDINYASISIPNFSPGQGTYIGTQQVTISDATTGTQIYFTTDGSLPTTSSTLYTGPITVSSLVGTVDIKAIAVKQNAGQSQVGEAKYTIVL